jgi:hypothetical protein
MTWVAFWAFCLLVAAISFAGITIVVAWRGLAEIRELVRQLSAGKPT